MTSAYFDCERIVAAATVFLEMRATRINAEREAMIQKTIEEFRPGCLRRWLGYTEMSREAAIFYLKRPAENYLVDWNEPLYTDECEAQRLAKILRLAKMAPVANAILLSEGDALALEFAEGAIEERQQEGAGHQ